MFPVLIYKILYKMIYQQITVKYFGLFQMQETILESCKIYFLINQSKSIDFLYKIN